MLTPPFGLSPFNQALRARGGASTPASNITGLPFGDTVATSSTPSTVYLGSPDVLKTSSGRYIMTHDYFGTGTTMDSSGVTSVYYTDDIEGGSYIKAADISDMFWGSLFEYDGDIYLLGTDHRFGDLSLSKSTDDGETWSTPVTVLTAASGGYNGWAKSPSTIIFKDGYLVTAIEAVATGAAWATRFKACLIFADLTDLENPSSWSHSNIQSLDTTAFVNSGIFSNTSNAKLPGGSSPAKGFLEGQLIELSDGSLRLFMRLEQTPTANHLIYMDVSWNAGDPPTSTVSTTQNFVDFPGGNVKFHIEYDSTSDKLWAISNLNRYRYFADGRIEGFLLSSDDDGLSWSVHQKVLGYDVTIDWEAEINQYGVQYSSFIIDGNDLLVASRTADAGADDWHNSNKMTITRVQNFRSISAMTFAEGSLVIDENSERLEDVNGIAVIHDQSRYFNSPSLQAAQNSSKVPWNDGLDFDGSNYLRVIHDRSLNPDNGFTVFAVVENLSGASGLRLMSKSSGSPSTGDVNPPDWVMCPHGFLIGGMFTNFSDVSAGNDYIFAATFDSANDFVYNYLNGSNRGEPDSLTGGSWDTDHIVLNSTYPGGNFAELLIGRRSTSTTLGFTSKVKAIRIFPEFKNASEVAAIFSELNSQYSIY